MQDKNWPFAESLEEICNLDTWTETTGRFAVPPHVAANMRRLGVTNEPSATALPLTVDALCELTAKHWPLPAIEDAMGWPRRRIASVLGGVSHMRHTEFGGRRPYRFYDSRNAASRRPEMWMDASQASAVRAAGRG